MKKITLTLLLLPLYSFIWAQQHDKLAPILYNSNIISETSNGIPQYSAKSTEEGNVITKYLFDTLNLPFIDDFSRPAKIRDYDYKLTDPGVVVEIDIDYTVNDDTLAELKAMKDTTYTYFFNGTAMDSIAKSKLVVKYYYDENDHSLITGTDTFWLFTDSILVNGIIQLDSAATPDTVLVNKCDTIHIVPDGSGSIWTSSSVYQNEHYAIDPPTIGVITLDGLDSLGLPYNIGSPNAYGLADKFESYPIYLKTKPGGGNYNILDELALGFYVQRQGWGDEPEVEDSLVLSFYSPKTETWVPQWNSNDITDNEFHAVFIPITNDDFFQDGFQFRFQNYASLNGNFDHWHIDYIRLQEQLTEKDTIIEDVAFVNQSEGLLKDYSQMPWLHYNFADDQESLMRPVSDPLVQTIRNMHGNNRFVDYWLEVSDTQNVIYNDKLSPQPNFPAESVNQKDFDRKSFVFPIDQSSTNDRNVFKVASILDPNFGDLINENDTVFYTQNFGTFYSYDDNSAEQAYFVQGAKARIAVRYVSMAPGEDTLKAVNIHIPRTKEDISNNLFRVKVWKSINPSVLIGESIVHNPIFVSGVNFAHRFEFEDTILVADTFYVGIEQISDPVHIGFDRNFNSRENNFYSVGGQWFNASFDGSLMIHPEFGSTYNRWPVGVEDLVADEQNNYRVYPNPANNYIAIKGDYAFDSKQIEVYSIQGKLLRSIGSYSGEPIRTDDLSSGFYLVRMLDVSGNQIFTDKFIIAK